MAPHLLLLGGTTEASALAQRLAEAGANATFSYAGRVKRPKPQPLPTRSGGFGGADGLADYIRSAGITHVVDATHPFASQMSCNAVAACRETDIPLVALTRPPWLPQEGDNWTRVGSITAATQWLAQPVRRVMLAIGRMHLSDFAGQPQHFYLLRFVEAPAQIPMPHYVAVTGMGPFNLEEDTRLLQEHRIDLVVSKNAGGGAARAKLDAARALNLPVLMIDRPAMPERAELHDVEAVFDWFHAGAERGV